MGIDRKVGLHVGIGIVEIPGTDVRNRDRNRRTTRSRGRKKE